MNVLCNILQFSVRNINVQMKTSPQVNVDYCLDLFPSVHLRTNRKHQYDVVTNNKITIMFFQKYLLLSKYAHNISLKI